LIRSIGSIWTATFKAIWLVRKAIRDGKTRLMNPR